MIIELDLSNKNLTTLPILPHTLQKLNCADNQLTSLSLPRSLKVLNCSGNQLTSIPYLPELQELYCHNNLLTSLPTLPKIQRLFCNGNRLTQLPELPDTLQKMYCKSNQLMIGIRVSQHFYDQDVWLFDTKKQYQKYQEIRRRTNAIRIQRAYKNYFYKPHMEILRPYIKEQGVLNIIMSFL
jgi:hypothetical protein